MAQAVQGTSGTPTVCIKPRRVPPQNLVMRLMERETFGCRRPGTQFHVARQFYQNVFPNFTLSNVEKPPCFLRKFSPDGKYLIAFSSDQTSLEVYAYRGPAAAAHLLQAVTGTAADKVTFERVFNLFFKMKYVINVSQSAEQLNRECSLFSEDGRYVIVGSASYIPDDHRPNFYEIYTNNEYITPNPRLPLEDYTLHIVDLHRGKLCDSRHFKIDRIYLSHNQGLYLYRDTLAVLSVQHQIIHVFQVLDGQFVDVRRIGRFCYEDDGFVLHSTYPMERAFREHSIHSLKHRLLTYLFQRAHHISTATSSPHELRKFYQYFDNFLSLKLWKMQLLDENHMLLKYASEDVVTMKSATDANTQHAFFVVYNMPDSRVLAVYQNMSRELMVLFENFCDTFRNAFMNTHFTCSPSNNIYARLIHNRFKQTIVSAKFGGRTEATKRCLSQLPISAQSFSSSPYLDFSLFSYDDKWVSVMERPKPCGEHPIRFYARDSGILKFKIYAGSTNRSPAASMARRLVAFTFHPTDPFAISVQRTNAEYIVNFHLRRDPALDLPTDKSIISFL